jgi:hypothetical protein
LLPHEEFRIGEFYLLVVEKERSVYRLYVGVDGEHYTHYDTGTYPGIPEAVQASRRGFDPGPFNAFPYAPFSRKRVLEQAPHGFESLSDDEARQGRR